MGDRLVGLVKTKFTVHDNSIPYPPSPIPYLPLFKPLPRTLIFVHNETPTTLEDSLHIPASDRLQPQ